MKRPLSNCVRTKEQNRGWEDKFAFFFVLYKENCKFVLSAPPRGNLKTVFCHTLSTFFAISLTKTPPTLSVKPRIRKAVPEIAKKIVTVLREQQPQHRLDGIANYLKFYWIIPRCKLDENYANCIMLTINSDHVWDQRYISLSCDVRFDFSRHFSWRTFGQTFLFRWSKIMEKKSQKLIVTKFESEIYVPDRDGFIAVNLSVSQGLGGTREQRKIS